MAIVSLSILPGTILADTLFHDDFNGVIVDPGKWHIPTWEPPGDQTFVGRTQFRCTQHSPLPAAQDGNAILLVETYNPTGFSFYGTDLISNPSFSLGQGIQVIVRAKMNTTRRGIVGGIFLYALKSEITKDHDEIDFELLTNHPGGVLTNVYANEPHDDGHPQFVSYSSGSITDYHTYEIKWHANKIAWFVDGNLIRKETRRLPTGPMNLHLNIWVPDEEFELAYDSGLQPERFKSENQIYSMSFDSVSVQSIPKVSSSLSILPLLLLDEP